MDNFSSKIRRISAILFFSGAILQGQALTVGPPVPLPELPSFDRQPAILALPDAGFVVASNSATSHRTSTLHFATTDPTGEQILQVWDQSHHIPLQLGMVSSLSTDFFAVALDQADLFIPNRLQASLFDPRTGEVLRELQINPEGTFPTTYDSTRLAGANLLAVWTDTNPNADGNGPAGLSAQIVDPEGELLGAPIHILDGDFREPKVAADAAGGFMVTWIDESDSGVYARAFDSSGVGQPIHRVATPDEAAAQLSLAALPNGNYILVFSEVDPSDPSMIFARRINPFGQPFQEKISVSSFSDPVKIDPRVVADRFGRSWVVWAERLDSSTSDVFLRILDADGTAGAGLLIPPVESAMQFDPVIAVNDQGLAMVAWREGASAPTFGQIRARTVSARSMCATSDTVLCLRDGRFQVSVVWTDHEGRSGAGNVLPFQSTDSGIFWFFKEPVWELMVKVLDGCSFNGFFWVFSAATTDVAFELVVTDTSTGQQRTYVNELGEAAPANTDITALLSCPHGLP